MAKPYTYTATLPCGTVVRRNSHRTYTHIAAVRTQGAYAQRDGWGQIGFAGTEALARRNAATWQAKGIAGWMEFAVLPVERTGGPAPEPTPAPVAAPPAKAAPVAAPPAKAAPQARVYSMEARRADGSWAYLGTALGLCRADAVRTARLAARQELGTAATVLRCRALRLA
jgi:hypothetical protein